MNDFISVLEKELKDQLPGIDYQYMMAPDFRGVIDFSQPFQEAAVLILIYPKNNSFFTVFIKRSEYNGAHSGQISFPGGKLENSDKSLKMTALRETEEEIGVRGSKIRILGQLTLLHIPVSNFNVSPFVGYIQKVPEFRIDPEEVEYLIQTDILKLTEPDMIEYEKMMINETEINVPYYQVSGNHIWGATAMILSEFLEIIKRVKMKNFPKA